MKPTIIITSFLLYCYYSQAQIFTLNGQTGTTQTFSTGASAEGFGISSSSNVHTFLVVDATPSTGGFISKTTQEFSGFKTFNTGVNVSATTGNSFILNTDDFVYDASNNRIGVNTTTPEYFFDLWPGLSFPLEGNNPFFILRNNLGIRSFVAELDANDNIYVGLRDSLDVTKVKFRTVGMSFIDGKFAIGDSPTMTNYPQLKVEGDQNLTDDINDVEAYQVTIQNETDVDESWAALGFGVDANKNKIGGYIAFERIGDNSFGDLHFGVRPSEFITDPDDVLIITRGNVNFPNVSSSSIACFDATNNLISGTIGTGLNLSSDVLSWSPPTYVSDVTLWDAANASRTFTASLSGSTDPVITFSNNSLDVTTGVLKNAGNPVTTQVGTPVHLTGQTAAIGSTSIYTVPADGVYLVCWNAAITTAATTSSTLGPLQITWTNQIDNVAKTNSSLNNYNGSNANVHTGNGSGIGGSTTVVAKSGTTINYSMGYASSGSTAMVYSLDVVIVKIF